MSNSINGIYLPGWEFNRLLGETPIEARISALPGAFLWNGAAQFWMFEKVYCTKESYENEAYSAQELNWATGRIFTELSASSPTRDPILHTVDWNDLDDPTKDMLRQVHGKYKYDIGAGGSGHKVRRWINEYDDSALQLATSELLKPVASSMGSLVAGSMGGLRQWISTMAIGGQLSSSERDERIQALLRHLSRPIDRKVEANGMRLLAPPSEWRAEALRRQDDARKRVETPYIRDLQAGEGEFSGPRGYEPYIRRVGTERLAYREINDALWKNWEENKSSLLRLRYVASRHLWPDLHGQWLPALVNEEPDAVKDFSRWMSRGLKGRHIAPLLNMSTKQIFAVSAASVGVAGVSDSLPIDLTAIGALGASLAVLWERRLAPQSGALAVFYQQAFKTLGKRPPRGNP
ncbi:hypothetical protein IU474_25975 [Nocardia otitidiscaviarum]|uniref:hypothetical protein n=1 Tax=Nocardia otitidiscaviarum TaxID=1823 RepID=UPI001893A55B|nr:hypothetical protein [Nocardia otitidiscaviarum]MBF6240497.1 hypothetical protein [Nocardia otitidiscaviarum]